MGAFATTADKKRKIRAAAQVHRGNIHAAVGRAPTRRPDVRVPAQIQGLDAMDAWGNASPTILSQGIDIPPFVPCPNRLSRIRVDSDARGLPGRCQNYLYTLPITN